MEPLSQSQRAREIFEAAMDLDSAVSRQAFVRKACDSDAQLWARVLDLLRAGDAAASWLPDHPADPRQTANLGERAGDLIGRYRLLEEIGAGGCGVVFRAEQEEPVRRLVALKVIKLGMDTKSVIARFEAERQALALMDHPNIARVFDGGTTEAGRPFFVMELVSGERITDYCKTHQVGTRERLELYIQVCNAVQHAHQKGIIHRDLKPSNILVARHDSVAVPKVIDFGIAKATAAPLTERTALTHDQLLLGTPAYMSPEQMEFGGVNIDTRSDIYSLGVLLYELLTGGTPFDTQELLKGGLDKMRQVIREQEPLKPSARIERRLAAKGETLFSNNSSLRAPRKSLANDLDWIVMKCLEKDRARRYATANGLAFDLRRYLNDEPVEARPPSRGYRLRKLVRRNRGTFAALTAIALLLVTEAGVSTWLTMRARRAEAAERESREKAETNESRAQAAREAAHLQAYTSDMKSASAAVAAGDFGQAEDLLRRYRPQGTEPDSRSLDWRYFWAASRGNEIQSFAQDRWINCARLSPDGTKLALALFGGETRVLDTVTGKNLLTFPGASENYAVETCAFSPDGKYFAVGSDRGTTIWNMRDWKTQHLLPSGTEAMAFSPDGRRFACLESNSICLYGTEDGKLHGRIHAPAAGFARMAFSADSRQLACLFRSSTTIQTWDAETLAPTAAYGEVQFPLSLAFSPTGRWLAVGNSLGELRLWDLRTQSLAATWPAHARYLFALAFSPDGTLLASGGGDQSIHLWSLPDNGKAEPIKKATLRGHRNEIWSLSFAPDGKQLLSAGRDGTAKLWNPQHPTEATVFLQGPPDSIALGFLPDARYFITFVPATKRLQIWDTIEAKVIRETPVSPQGALVLCGPQVCYGTTNGEVVTVHLPSGELGRRVALTEGPLLAVQMSGDQKLFLGFDKLRNQVTLWNLETAQRITTFPDFEVPEMSPSWAMGQRAAFSPDARWLAYASTNYSVQVWDVMRQRPASNLKGHAWHIQCMRFSPDSSRLMTGGWDGLARIWDPVTGRELLPPLRHQTGVGSVSFSSDGRTLITRGGDDILHFWMTSTGLESGTVQGVTAWFFNPVSADGNSLAWEMGNLSARFKILHLPTFETIDRLDRDKIP